MTFRTASSLAALALTLGLSAQAMAQSTPAPQPAPAAKAPVAAQITLQDADTVLASKDIIGQTVYAPDDAKIGSISDLIVSKDGKNVQGFVIGVGGFLGIGERSVAFPMDKLRIATAADGSAKLSMDVRKEDLANAPAFKSLREVAQENKQPTPIQPSTPQRRN
jgi:hypothetical protein